MTENRRGRWPIDKATRSCNLGDCPAFKSNPNDYEAEAHDSRFVAVRRTLPTGTCLAANKSVVIGAGCTVEDDDFKAYMQKPKEE